MKRNYLLALASAALSVTAFSPFGAGLLAWIALVPLFFALKELRPRKAFYVGWTYGILFFTGTVYWVIHSMYFYGHVPAVAGLFVMLALSAYLSLYPALFASFMNTGPALKRSAFAPFLVATLWVATEYMRGHLFTGFPWVLLGYSQVPYPVFIQFADIGGVWALSFMIAAVNYAFYMALDGLSKGDRSRLIVGAVTAPALLTMLFVYGSIRIKEMDEKVPGWPAMKVGIAQGNIDQSIKWGASYRKKTLEVYKRLSLKAAERGAELIVWPETAVPFYLESDEPDRSRVLEIPVTTGALLVTGSPRFDFDEETGSPRYYNSAYLIGRQGAVIARYDKVHLVPFGEYVPVKRFLPFVEKLVEGVGDFSPGPGPVPLRFDGEGFGVLICFESIFPELGRALVKEGATLVFNLTNDAWFGRTSAPYQHFDMAVLRAVETRTFVIRAANTGISGVIDPAGRVLERSGLFEEAVITRKVGLRRGPETFYVRYGDIFAYLCIAASAAFLAGSLFMRRRR